VKRATFNYGDERFVWKIKMASLSRKRTQVFARYTLGAWRRQGARYDVVLKTKYDSDGNRRAIGHWSRRTGAHGRFTDGLTARWDWRRRVVVFTLTSHLKGRIANAWAFSIAKGAQHGPPCGDYIGSGRIRRG
jgi:hypothetical protein